MPRLEEPKRRTRIRSTYRPTRRQREIAAEHGMNRRTTAQPDPSYIDPRL
jgi:hypothetical protein